MPDLVHLVYQSAPARRLDEGDVDAILGPARRFNADHEVTGCLLVLRDGGAEVSGFVQWIEGPASAIFRCFARILRDDRHQDLRVLRRGPIAARSYPGWSMRDEVVLPGQLEAALEAFGLDSLV